MAIIKNKGTLKHQEFWDHIGKVAAYVRTPPDWMKGSATNSRPAPACGVARSESPAPFDDSARDSILPKVRDLMGPDTHSFTEIFGATSEHNEWAIDKGDGVKTK